MERKNCSLTQFKYNSDSAKDTNEGGNVNFKIALNSLVSIQCEPVHCAKPLFIKIFSRRKIDVLPFF